MTDDTFTPVRIEEPVAVKHTPGPVLRVVGPRTAEIEEVPNPGYDQYRWRLRKYGYGAGVIARGVPNYFHDRSRADEARDLWLEHGK